MQLSGLLSLVRDIPACATLRQRIEEGSALPALGVGHTARPFLAAAVWAVMIVVSTWPLLKSLQLRFGGRRGLAVTVMTLAMLLLLVVPLWLAIDTIASHAEAIVNLARKFAASGLPQPPAWVGGVPLIGGKLSALWEQLADAGSQGLMAKAEPYAAQSLSLIHI